MVGHCEGNGRRPRSVNCEGGRLGSSGIVARRSLAGQQHHRSGSGHRDRVAGDGRRTRNHAVGKRSRRVRGGADGERCGAVSLTWHGEGDRRRFATYRKGRILGSGCVVARRCLAGLQHHRSHSRQRHRARGGNRRWSRYEAVGECTRRVRRRRNGEWGCPIGLVGHREVDRWRFSTYREGGVLRSGCVAARHSLAGLQHDRSHAG